MPTGQDVFVPLGGKAAYCILQLDKAANNPNLLAHELGHVFGVGDAGSGGMTAGEFGTVMQQVTPNPGVISLKIFNFLERFAPTYPETTAKAYLCL